MNKRVGRSKWEKWKCIQQAPHLAVFQPRTAIYSLDQLKLFLTMYPFVYVKPDGRSFGQNVIRVTRFGTRYKAQRKKEVKQYVSLEQFDHWLSTVRNTERYIVQQGISLAKVEGRPVDIRSVIIKNELGKWEVTAYVAKQAGVGSVITNHAAGGRILTVEDYLNKLKLTQEQKQIFNRRFNKLSIDVGGQLGKYYSNHIYGLDIGLDESKKLWLIEANTNPDNRFLPTFNQKMYNRTQQLIGYNKQA